ncbi:PEST proteolytic signal-containing nuclear protein isoform X1 [Pygocentrus nattereri]|uniref:PEST proteolytic signal-containing nuclear protein isoform X1 n=1 Tax=Pygocentrus nattereri TaxID=42514 RepID=UPI001891B38D|nr:PEST proteolytic signal-containing nuclear protein isoform X1 [Pygocentrus nattereri]
MVPYLGRRGPIEAVYARTRRGEPARMRISGSRRRPLPGPRPFARRVSSSMANEQQWDGVEQHGGAGPEEKGGSVKSNTVSSSTGPGGGLGKRPASSSSSSRTEDECKKQHVPFKLAKPGFSAASQSLKKSPISIKLGASKPKEAAPAVPVKKPASVFDDDDSEPEEMPPEAKMRMKNIGRDTPTSAGPNSFNKGKQGFSDHQKLWERKLKSLTDK